MSEPAVSCNGVKKTFIMGKEEVHALRGITVDIAKGEYVSIMGPSGSGKSTLFVTTQVPARNGRAPEGIGPSQLHQHEA
jgi:putative ABC transport system ATP-binding protein